MDKLTQLAKQYKKTKDKNICQQIFNLLDNAIKQKASYVFYKQKFIKDRNKVYEMEIFNRESKSFQKKLVPSCFRLCDTKKLELEDVAQELNLKILELLNNYNVKKPFRNYLFYTLKRWRPSCIRDINFIRELNMTHESDLSHRNGKKITLDMLAVSNPEEVVEVDDLFDNMTEFEKKVVNLKLEYPTKNQSQLAKMLGVRQQKLSEILADLKKKCKYYR